MNTVRGLVRQAIGQLLQQGQAYRACGGLRVGTLQAYVALDVP